MFKTFASRHPSVGPVLWIASIQYYIVQLVAGLDFTGHYSLLTNTISDLGNTSCGLYGSRQVCSPLHDVMNVSFIVLGLTMFFGAMLLYQRFHSGKTGFLCMALAGIGTVLVGLFPENTVGILHILGAALPFLIGNLGMVILSFTLKMPKILRYYTFASGFIPLIALILLLTQYYLGLGIGGMERITAYPQTLWLIIFGVWALRNRAIAAKP